MAAIPVGGPIHPLEMAIGDYPATQAPMMPSLDRVWCGREDSNFHVLSDTTTSTLRVYQFRHDRT